MLFNGMASVVDCAAQRPSRRLESVELIMKFNKCDRRQFKLLTGCVSPSPRFRVCVVGDERHIREAVDNNLDFLDLPAIKEIGKIPAVARVIAQKYDAFLVSKPVLGKFNAYFGYALAGASKAPPFGLSVEQPVMAGVEEAKNTARIRRKACCRRCFFTSFYTGPEQRIQTTSAIFSGVVFGLSGSTEFSSPRNELVVIVGHVTMLPEHLTQNVNRVVTHLTRMLTENPDVAVHSLCIKSTSGPKLKLC
ncbi:hypothetical protein MRX96_011214 [Rhipicephalus microplus]